MEKTVVASDFGTSDETIFPLYKAVIPAGTVFPGSGLHYSEQIGYAEYTIFSGASYNHVHQDACAIASGYNLKNEPTLRAVLCDGVSAYDTVEQQYLGIRSGQIASELVENIVQDLRLNIWDIVQMYRRQSEERETRFNNTTLQAVDIVKGQEKSYVTFYTCGDRRDLGFSVLINKKGVIKSATESNGAGRVLCFNEHSGTVMQSATMVVPSGTQIVLTSDPYRKHFFGKELLQEIKKYRKGLPNKLDPDIISRISGDDSTLVLIDI